MPIPLPSIFPLASTGGYILAFANLLPITSAVPQLLFERVVFLKPAETTKDDPTWKLLT